MTIFDTAKTCSNCRLWNTTDSGRASTTVEPFDEARECRNTKSATAICPYTGGLLPIYTLPTFSCAEWRAA